LLADVMALQAGFPALDFSNWNDKKTVYFAAIGQGVEMNYKPMEKCVGQALLKAYCMRDQLFLVLLPHKVSRLAWPYPSGRILSGSTSPVIGDIWL